MEKETTQTMASATQNYAIPVSIVIAGALIALGLYFASNNQQVAQGGQYAQPQEESADTTDQVRPVDETDHIKGAENAKVTIVEYSDFECPFCQRLHQTMNEILKEETDVAWVYRQFPLDSLHPRNARKASVASECVNKLGGNDAFWKFTDEYMRTTPTNDRWDIDEELPRLVTFAGVDKTAFDACYASGEFDQHVQDDVDNAIATGGRGTPWSIVITASGKTLPLNGAQPKEAIKQLIEYARNN